GFGHFHPKWLQCLNHRWALITVVCLQVFIAGMLVNGFDTVTVSSVEKRFHLKSTEIGAFPACEEVSAAITGFLASYYAGQRHKGKFLATGAAATGIGAIIYALPHFFAGQYHPASPITNYTDLCMAKPSSFAAEICQEEGSRSNTFVRNFFFVFILGQIIIGAGNNLLWNIGCAYVDENVHPTSSAMYLAAMLTLSTVGPSVGLQLASRVLRMYVDSPASAPEGLTILDPRWIGAWWICFLIAGVGLLIISIPLYGFPRHLPNYEKYKKMRQEKANETSKIDYEYGYTIKDMLKASKELVTNKPYMLLVGGLVSQYVTVSGLGYFLIKIFEAQFRMPAYQAGPILSYIALGGGAGGMLMGGVVMKLFKMNGAKAAQLAFFLGIVDTIAAATFLAGCPNLPFAGVNSPYSANLITDTPKLGEPILAATCNSGCMCNDVKYNPICGVDGTTYFSPCHAGCSSSIYVPQYYTYAYLNCSCIKKENNLTSAFDARGGLCSASCSLLTPFYVGLTIYVLASSAKIVSAMEAILRSVPESQRSYAMGLNWAFLRLAASMPGPIIVGIFIDQSCILWTKNCDSSSTCWVYDSKTISYYITILIAIVKTLGTICFFFSWWHHKSHQIT
ncbi:uncharacterized protein TRIADDRAFT_11683, partial [Trichoplax adhaerens]